MNSEFFAASGSIGAALIGTWFISRQLSFEKIQKLLEFITSFNDRYDKIIAKIPLTVLLDNDDKELKDYGSEDKEIERAIYDYFALCEEELGLVVDRSERLGFWGEGSAAAEVWDDAILNWKCGILGNSKLALFSACLSTFEKQYAKGSGGQNRGEQFSHLRQLLAKEDYLDAYISSSRINMRRHRR